MTTGKAVSTRDRLDCLEIRDPGHWLLRHLTLTETTTLGRHQRDQLRAAIADDWLDGARCASADPEAWFPAPGQAAVPQVRLICAGCPVRRSCLASALLHGEEGVWAGTTAFQRRTAYRLLRAGQTVNGVLNRMLAGPTVTATDWETGAAA